MNRDIKEAMDILRKVIKNDEGYAISWQSNIAMCCYDAMREEFCDILHEDAHYVANDAANRFMKLCFDYESKVN